MSARCVHLFVRLSIYLFIYSLSGDQRVSNAKCNVVRFSVSRTVYCNVMYVHSRRATANFSMTRAWKRGQHANQSTRPIAVALHAQAQEYRIHGEWERQKETKCEKESAAYERGASLLPSRFAVASRATPSTGHYAAIQFHHGRDISEKCWLKCSLTWLCPPAARLPTENGKYLANTSYIARRIRISTARQHP